VALKRASAATERLGRWRQAFIEWYANSIRTTLLRIPPAQRGRAHLAASQGASTSGCEHAWGDGATARGTSPHTQRRAEAEGDAAPPRGANVDESSSVAGGLSPFLMRDRRVTV
jgi:hypothetical protein